MRHALAGVLALGLERQARVEHRHPAPGVRQAPGSRDAGGPGAHHDPGSGLAHASCVGRWKIHPRTTVKVTSDITIAVTTNTSCCETPSAWGTVETITLVSR